MECEYIFGTNGNAETLRVKGPAHTALSGFQEVRQEWPGETVTHRFRIVRKLKEAEDPAGNCYDWYEIDHHYRVADKTGPVAEQVGEIEAAIERGFNL